MAASYHGLGNVYYRKGDYTKAIEYYEKSLAISLKTLGAEHPDTKNMQEWIDHLRAKSSIFD